MKKQFLAFCALGMSLTCWAEKVPALKIQTAQEENIIRLSDINKVQYSETEMVVLLTNGTQQTFIMDHITAMAFDNVDEATALRSITDTGRGQVTTFDLGGRKVSATKQGGIYIIKMGKETRKLKK